MVRVEAVVVVESPSSRNRLRLTYELVVVEVVSLELFSLSRSVNNDARLLDWFALRARYESTSFSFDLSSSKFRDDGLTRLLGWYDDCLASRSCDR